MRNTLGPIGNTVSCEGTIHAENACALSELLTVFGRLPMFKQISDRWAALYGGLRPHDKLDTLDVFDCVHMQWKVVKVSFLHYCVSLGSSWRRIVVDFKCYH